jgi:hypothetical protein
LCRSSSLNNAEEQLAGEQRVRKVFVALVLLFEGEADNGVIVETHEGFEVQNEVAQIIVVLDFLAMSLFLLHLLLEQVNVVLIVFEEEGD